MPEPQTTPARYQTIHAALTQVARLISRAQAVYEAEGPRSEREAMLLGEAVEASLALTVHAGELEWGETGPHRLQSRVAIAGRALDLVINQITYPMDAPLAYLCAADALVGRAMEEM